MGLCCNSELRRFRQTLRKTDELLRCLTRGHDVGESRPLRRQMRVAERGALAHNLLINLGGRCGLNGQLLEQFQPRTFDEIWHVCLSISMQRQPELATRVDELRL